MVSVLAGLFILNVGKQNAHALLEVFQALGSILTKAMFAVHLILLGKVVFHLTKVFLTQMSPMSMFCLIR